MDPLIFASRRKSGTYRDAPAWQIACKSGVVKKLIGLLVVAVASARASVTLFLEEPYGTFGGMNPTGHAAVYLSNICAASPVELRRCEPGEHGVVISRYHRVGGYDWLAIPLLPYLYAVDRTDDVPLTVSVEDVATLRDSYRKANLTQIIPDAEDGDIPKGDWTQLVGAAYDRTIYAFGIESTEAQDDAFIKLFNTRRNTTHFNLFFFNCADFSRQAIDTYYRSESTRLNSSHLRTSRMPSSA